MTVVPKEPHPMTSYLPLRMHGETLVLSGTELPTRGAQFRKLLMLVMA